MSKAKVLVVATSRKTRGGITSVVKAHENGAHWGKYKCKWIQTHVDRSGFVKVWYFFISFLKYCFNLPFYKIIHFHLSEPSSALRKLGYFLLAKFLRKKVIIHFHSYSIETTLNSKYRWLYLYMFRKATLCIVLSEYWKKELQSSISGISKVLVLLNPSNKIDENRFGKNKTKNILFAGTINERKGFKDLISAFANVAKEFSDWKITFAGNGDISEGKKLARNLNILDQVEFLGWVSGDEKEKLFANSSVFCLPSYAEGLPMALLDAWTYGLPSIVTPVGGIPDVAINEENCLVFKPGDITELTECLYLMLSNKDLRDKLTYESKKLSNEKFSIEIISDQLDNIYKDVINI